MKKIFHRKDDAESPNSINNDTVIGTSLYDSTAAAGQPQHGDYPIKGYDSTSNILQQQQPGRKSSVRSRRSSGSFSPPWRSPTPMSSSPANNPTRTEPLAPYQHQTPTTARGHDEQNRRSRTSLPREFANMTLGNEGQSKSPAASCFPHAP